MTKLTYDIFQNGNFVKNVTNYQQALTAVSELGNGCTYKAIYTPFDPDDTSERRKVIKTMREKLMKKRAERNALKN